MRNFFLSIVPVLFLVGCTSVDTYQTKFIQLKDAVFKEAVGQGELCRIQPLNRENVVARQQCIEQARKLAFLGTFEINSEEMAALILWQASNLVTADKFAKGEFDTTRFTSELEINSSKAMKEINDIKQKREEKADRQKLIQAVQTLANPQSKSVVCRPYNDGMKCDEQ